MMDKIYTTAAVSPTGKVNAEDLQQVLRNMWVFLAPLALVYFLQLNGVLQHGALKLADLIPNQTTWGAAQLYLVNAGMDLARKFQNNKV